MNKQTKCYDPHGVYNSRQTYIHLDLVLYQGNKRWI
jgi:hypothetical protein